MQYVIIIKCEKKWPCLQATVVKTKERKSSLWNLLSSRWTYRGTFIPNIIIIIIFVEERGWVTRHEFYWKFWIFWNKVKKNPLLIISVSATGRQSHSLTLCSDCIDRIVQFWSLTWEKKKLCDRGNNSCFDWRHFWYTLEIWKWQREEEENVIKATEGDAVKKENCNQSSI